MEGTIRFGNELPTLIDYGNVPWELNEKHFVEFYPDFYISVLLISTETPFLQKHLEDVSNGSEPISLDLEWEEELCLFQFCSSKGCLIIRHPNGPGNSTLRSFLENHQFYGKGNHNDHQKLKEKFGSDFSISLEDVERTRLIPNNCSINFIKMNDQFAGKSTAVFKDKEMTFSNWNSEKLSKRQVLYAAFDVVALFKCYPNFPPPSMNQPPIKTKVKTSKSQKRCINFDFDPVLKKKNPIVNPYSIDSSVHLFCYVLMNYKGSSCILDIKCNIIKSCNFKDDSVFDYLSVIQNGEKINVLVSLFSEINEDKFINLQSEKVIVVPEINPAVSSLFTKNDIFFLDDTDRDLLNHNSLNDFLYSFGIDFDFSIFENYSCIKPRDPYASLRMHMFLPFISKAKIHVFPSFLPILTVINNSNSEILDALQIPENKRKEIKVEYVSQKQIYNVTFPSIIEKDKAFEKWIKSNENEIFVTPFTISDQINLIESHKILFKNCTLTNSEVYDIFKEFGKLYSIKRNEILKNVYVEFCSKIDAYRCVSNLSKSYDIEILKGSTITLRHLPNPINEEEIINMCRESGEVLDIFFSEKQYVNVTFRTREQCIDCKDNFKLNHIEGNQIQVDIRSKSVPETPIWKIEQIVKWVKVNIDMKEELGEIFNQASKYGKIVDMKRKDNYLFIMFSTEESAEKMKKSTEGCEQCDFESFLFFLNKPLKLEEKQQPENDTGNLPRYMTRKVFILDPKPDELTDEKIEEIAFNWRSLISGVHNVDSINHPSKQRTIFYSGGKKRDQQIIDLIIKLGVDLGCTNKLKPIVSTFSNASRNLGVPPPPPKKVRRWVIIDPLPQVLNEESLRNICSEFEPFDIMLQNSSIKKGEKRAVILKQPHAREIFWKLNEMTFQGIKLNVIKVPPELAPAPLD